MLCSKLRCEKGFVSNPFSYKIYGVRFVDTGGGGRDKLCACVHVITVNVVSSNCVVSLFLSRASSIYDQFKMHLYTGGDGRDKLLRREARMHLTRFGITSVDGLIW